MDKDNMKFNRIIAAIIGCLVLLALPVSAETPILEELMRKYTFLLIFLSLAGAVAGIGYLYITGLLPKAIFETWRWIDERFALHRYVSLAKREYYSVVYTLMPATGRTMPQSHTERYNVKAIWYWYPFYSLGGLSFFAYIVLAITGIYLGFYYIPDGVMVPVDPEVPDGEKTSGAYQSMELIMTQVSFGYIIRAVHHWSAHFMVASVFLHMMRVYFVGAYRNPREINWMLGSILLMITIFFGYTGYLLPWDELGFAAGSIGLEMATSIPALGPLMAQIVFGGTQLTGDTITRMYWLHIFVLPLIGTILIIIHMALVWIQGEAEPH
ncbi:MAG: cytochrome b N-terminal domain-containing protein [Candidatus Poseidoniia archaeon]|nr:cytochrome b N-terminal domain-containing protein [Candidatus Poseidoniia archaeon]